MPVPLRDSDLSDAKLYANRYSMMSGVMANMHLPDVCEVGVAFGVFSKFMVETFKPRSYTAIDGFEIHKEKEFWGKPPSHYMGDLTHKEFYQQELRPVCDAAGTRLRTMEGPSWECLKLCGKPFDVIYLDAGHDEVSVRKDTLAAIDKIRPGGIIIFNDYLMYDHIGSHQYGVVEVANEFITKNKWKVVGLGLEKQMYCDLAVRV